MGDSSIHVVHVITRYLRRGGAERNTLLTMRALVEEGMTVTLAAGQGSELADLKDEPVSTETISNLTNDMNPIRDVRAIIELTSMFTRQDIDVVHTHQGKAGLVGRIAALLANVPMIVYGIHGDHVRHPGLNQFTRPIYHGIEQVLGRGTDYFVSVGRELMQRYLDRSIGSPDQHTVIHSGMHLEPFLRTGERWGQEEIHRKRRELGLDDPDVSVVGKVASLEPRKGYDDAICVARKVVNEMAPNPVRFLFVGSGPERDALEKKVREAGLQDEVIFTGYREDIAEVMACFDVFLFASHMEGLPQVLVQAAATGLPIVTFQVEGAEEVIDDGTSGWIVPDRDVDRAAGHLTKLLRNSSLRNQAGTRARNRADERWTVDFMKKRVKSFYRKVLDNM